MQVLVMYYSRTGNTKKLAEAVAEGVAEVNDVKCVLKSVAEVTKDDFLSSDGIIAGSPVYFGILAAELKAVFDKFVGLRSQMENKIGAAFATAGSPDGGKETTIMSILQSILIYGMMVVGDPMEATGHFGVSCTGVPDKQTIGYAKKTGKRVAALVKKLKG